LKEKREEYGISQNKLAAALGVTREYLNRLEKGKKLLFDEEKKLSIFETLERFNPAAPLNLMIDYLRVRFQTIDFRYVIEDILNLRMEQMVHSKFADFGYAENYAYGDIVVMTTSDSTLGTLLELRGKGCRQFENVLVAQKYSWYDFLARCICVDAVIKRIDLAVNDVNGILDIGELIRKSQEGESVSLFRTFNCYASGELTKERDSTGMGQTLYVGSFSSDMYFCIYEKDYEQYIKRGIPVEEALIKNRFEIRLMNDRAEMAVRDLLAYQDEERTVFGIINRYLKFVDRGKGERRDRWPLNPHWEHFIGKGRERIKLTVQPEPYTYERTLKWLKHQVGASIKMGLEIDRINGTEFINTILQEAELSDKHKRIIQQVTVPVESIIKKI
jgi:Putative phage replication protein RstA